MLINLKAKKNYNWYKNTLKNDCYLIFNLLDKSSKYNKILPEFTKLSLNLNIKGAHSGFNKDDYKKDVISSFSFLEALTGKKPYGVSARRPYISEGIRKGDPLGAKRTLYGFDNYLILKNLISKNQLNFNNKNIHKLKKYYYNISLRINDLFIFKNMNQKYEFFYDQKHLDININFNSYNKENIKYFLNRFF